MVAACGLGFSNPNPATWQWHDGRRRRPKSLAFRYWSISVDQSERKGAQSSRNPPAKAPPGRASSKTEIHTFATRPDLWCPCAQVCSCRAQGLERFCGGLSIFRQRDGRGQNQRVQLLSASRNGLRLPNGSPKRSAFGSIQDQLTTQGRFNAILPGSRQAAARSSRIKSSSETYANRAAACRFALG